MGTELKKLGYYFDANDEMRTLKDKEKFKFTSQEEYEEIGEAVTEDIYQLLETRFHLKRIELKPKVECLTQGEEEETSEQDRPRRFSFFFASENFDKKDTLLVLIHGSGVVRAGQWARRLIINDCLTSGTQFPYIERALKHNWGVIVMNTNETKYASNCNKYEYSGTPQEHSLNVWKWFVTPSFASQIYAVAHSRGSYDLSEVLNAVSHDDRLTKICLTDGLSFRYSPKGKAPPFVLSFVAGDEDSSEYKIDSSTKFEQIHYLYAGTDVHEESSACSIDSVFYLFENEVDRNSYKDVIRKCKKLIIRR